MGRGYFCPILQKDFMSSLTDKQQLDLRDDIAVSGVLTSVRNVKSTVNTVGGLDTVRFSEDGKDYASRSEREKALTQDDLDHISVDMPSGGTRWFKKIHSEAIDKLSDIEDAGNTTGFKAAAYFELNEAGDIATDANGKKKVIMAFEGWDGGLNDNSPQTNSMYAIGDAKLYPPATKVREFVDAVTQQTGDNISVDINTHSMGSINGMVAALALADKGIEVGENFQLEQVAASLAVRKLRETFTADESTLSNNQLALREQFPELVGAANFEPAMNKVIGNIEAARSALVSKDGTMVNPTNSALLETYKFEEGHTPTDNNNAITPEMLAKREENIAKGTERVKQRTGLGGIASWMTGQTQQQAEPVKRDENGLAIMDVDNQMVGGKGTYWADMTDRKLVGLGPVMLADPYHTTGTLAGAASDKEKPLEIARDITDLERYRGEKKQQQTDVSLDNTALAAAAAEEVLPDAPKAPDAAEQTKAAGETIEKSGVNRDTSKDEKMIRELQAALNAGPDAAGDLTQKYFAARKHFLGSEVEAGESDVFKEMYEKYADKDQANATVETAQHKWREHEAAANSALAAVKDVASANKVMQQYGAQLDTNMDKSVDGEHSKAFKGLDDAAKAAISAAAQGISGKVQLENVAAVEQPSVPNQGAVQQQAR